MRPVFAPMTTDQWKRIDRDTRVIISDNGLLWLKYEELFLNRIETHDKGCQ